MKILHLTLHKKWFDEIAAGDKVFEYREIKKHWTGRLMKDGKFKKFSVIHFVNGYGPHRPSMMVEFLGVTYGVFEGEDVYAIGLGKVLSVKNYKAGQFSLLTNFRELNHDRNRNRNRSQAKDF